MTPNEAKVVASILCEADSGCGDCVGRLVELATERLPGFDWNKLVDQAIDDWRNGILPLEDK